MEVILDTNFILSCLRKRIEFVEQLQEMGFRILIPVEVLNELKDLKFGGKVGKADRVVIDVAFQLLEVRGIKKVKLGTGKVDEGLIKKGKEGAYIATLDKAVQRIVPNRIVILSAKKSIKVERD